MKSYLIRSLGITLIAVLALVQLPFNVRAQTNNQAALAFIDALGNVYWAASGLGPGTALTQDADFRKSQAAPTHIYTHLRWSPDGSKLAFQDSIARNLLVSVSGGAPQVVASGIAPEYPPTWLPDSSAVAYVVNTQQAVGSNTVTMAIQQVAAGGGQPTMVGSFAAGQGCGGGGSDPAYILYMQETALNGNFLTFAWTKGGWLYSISCTGIGLALNNFNGDQQWRVDGLGRVVVSPSGTQAAAVLFNQTLQPTSLVVVDLATGRNGALNTGSAVDQVGWSADESQVLFSTIDGQNVSLWKIPVQGAQATQLFGDQGRYIGVITSTPDSQSAVFSYIPGGDNPQTQVLSVPMNGGVASRANSTAIAQGGSPAFAVPVLNAANVTPANVAGAANCTPRADWGFVYTVVPGDTVSSIARRTGTTVADLAVGNCLADASLIYAGQTLRLPGPPQNIPTNFARRIVFPRGATSVAVQGQVAANGTDSWVLRALAGQTMTAQLTFGGGQAILIVYGADGSVLMSDQNNSSFFSGVLPSTQDYFINVRGYPNGPTNYTLTITVPPVSAPQPAARRVVFPPGATSVAVQGQVAASGTDRWVLRAQFGQTMTAQLTFFSGQAILIVFGADGSVLMSDHAGASSFSGVLPSTQDYFIDVRGNPNGPTSYTLTITVPPVSAPQPTSRRVVFPRGSTSVAVQGQVAATGTDRWVVRALGGQTLTAQLTFFSGQAILIVYGADGSVLMSDHAGASLFSGVLPSTQDYIIDVRGNPNSSTSYNLTITIPPR